MSKIKIMPENLSNKIAAGEVIERPASVVKELMENSIDAGATSIKVEIEKAGSKLIQVTDNGSGMDSDDLLLSLEMHGTSKLTDESEIFNINTKGFRGEALPSISAISKFTMKSRRAEDLEGSMVKVHGGKFIENSPVGSATGTQIRVEDLFFNIPARKKFLKAQATEEHHIQEIFIMLSLIHPEISFSLTMDRRNVFNSPASNNLNSRIRAYFGKEFASEMLEVNYSKGDYHIQGYIAKPSYTKSSRKEQRTFVNKRVVESFAIYRGIKEGYATIAEKGRYNPCILFVNVPNSEVDINVHPAKKEVRFNHEYQVSNLISDAIQQSLTPKLEELKKEELAPSVFDNFQSMSGKVSMKSIMQDAYLHYEVKDNSKLNLPDEIENNYPVQVEKDEVEEEVLQNNLTDTRAMEKNADNQVEFVEIPIEKLDSNNLLDELSAEPFELESNVYYPEEVIGILDNSYILCRYKLGLMIIDQHAAHERILFEKLLAEYGKESVSQQLLFPEVIDLSISNRTLLLKNLKTFNKLGFDIEPLSKNSVMINGIPALFKISNASRHLEDLLALLLSENQTKTELTLELIARSACKAAVKFHDNITLDGAKKLLELLLKCQQPTLCPHGRPTIIEVTFKELIKRFQR